MRTCGFCDARADSREHAWPDWLLEELQRGSARLHGLPPGARISASVEAHRPGAPPLVWRGPKANVRVKRVCKRCNNEWMSRLEDIAKPIITPMLYGSRQAVPASVQFTLTLWSLKTAMVFDCLHKPGRMFYSSEDRSSLRRGLLSPTAIVEPLPAITRVWLAAYAGELPATSTVSRLYGDVSVRGRRQPLAGYVTTISAGGFVTQVLTSRLPDHAARTFDLTLVSRPGPWHEATVCIWPSFWSEARWPPPHILRDQSALDAFAQRWPRRPSVNIPPAWLDDA